MTAQPSRLLRRLYTVLVAALLLSMVALIAHDWPGLTQGARLAFTGLTVLGAVVAHRLARAHQEARRQASGWQERYVDHLGFTHISLWVGFLVVPALNLPAPQLAVPAVVLGTIGLGHTLIARHKRRALTGSAAAGAFARPPRSPSRSAAEVRHGHRGD